MARYSGVTEPAAAATQARDAAAGIAGQTQTRVFASQNDLWLLAEFDRPVSLERVTDGLGTVGGVGATLFNFYAPYWRK
jgi:hypothetical protein